MTTLAPDDVTALRIAIMRLARRLRTESTTTGVTPSQLAVLGSLLREGAQTPGQLAEHERISGPSITRIVAALEERGLVSRSPHPEDGRQVLVDLTDHARVQIDADLAQRNRWLRDRLNELPHRDQQALLALAPLLDQLARQ